MPNRTEGEARCRGKRGCAISRRIAALSLLAVVLSLLFALACEGSAGKNERGPDENLSSLVLRLSDFGEEFASFQEDPTNGPSSVEKKAEANLEPEREKTNLERFRWVAGYDESFFHEDAFEKASGVAMVSSGIDVFETDETASGYFAETRAKQLAAAGKRKGNVTVQSVDAFEPGLANESVGLLINARLTDESGVQHDFWSTTVAFRRGHLLASVTLLSFENGEFEPKLKELADLLDDRVRQERVLRLD